MILLCNRRMGPAAELLVAADVAAAVLRAIAAAAAARAVGRWERELAAWLEQRATEGLGLDVADIAWTPDHFMSQRGFALDAIDGATVPPGQAATLARIRALVEGHPREAVVVGRRWAWARPGSATA
jgi:hypothetical protein